MTLEYSRLNLSSSCLLSTDITSCSEGQRSHPFEVTLSPGVRISHKQKRHKHGHFAQSEETEFVVRECPGKQKQDFNVEDNEDQRIQVIARAKLNVRGTNGLHSAFIRLILDAV